MTGDRYMIKALCAVSVAAFFATGLTVLSKVEASSPQALAKADRLDIRPIGRDCSQAAWPNFEASCLRAVGARAAVVEVRKVTLERTP